MKVAEEKKIDLEENAGAADKDTQQARETVEENQQKDAPGDTQFEEPSQEEWRKALETAVKQRDEYLAMAQRTQADFSNFRRRNSQARADAYDEGVRETLSALLPVIDNLERAVDAARKQEQTGPLLEGVEMTLRQLLEAGRKLGLEEVPALGEKFDPEKHNAVMRAEEGEPGMVLEVFQKGYRVKDKIIRYAMVKVAAE